jgi:hypothetical protein
MQAIIYVRCWALVLFSFLSLVLSYSRNNIIF